MYFIKGSLEILSEIDSSITIYHQTTLLRFYRILLSNKDLVIRPNATVYLKVNI